MAARAYRVRVFVKQDNARSVEDPTRAFELRASHADAASNLARARIEGAGSEIVGLSHGPDRAILVTVSRTPRTAPPTITPRVVAGRTR